MRIRASHLLREHLRLWLLHFAQFSPPTLQHKTENRLGARGPPPGRRARTGRRGAGSPRRQGWGPCLGAAQRPAAGTLPYCFSGAPLTIGPYKPPP